LGAALSWHVAVWVTADGLSLADVGVTWSALLRGHPLTGVPGVRPASTAVTLTAFGVTITVMVAAVLAVVFALGSWQGNRRRGKGLAQAGQVRAGVGLERARQKAGHTRPSMTVAQIQSADPQDIALHIGNEESQALTAAEALGYPVVAKSAAPGEHKTERGGVVLDIRTPAELSTAIAVVGLPAVIQPMVRGGVEVMAGVVQESGLRSGGGVRHGRDAGRAAG